MKIASIATSKSYHIFLWLFSLLLFYVAVYFFFYPYRTTVLYGDDLYILKYYTHPESMALSADGKPIELEKFRPVSTYCSHLLYHVFHTQTACYYYFNVFVQALVALVFTAIVDLVLQNWLFSFGFGLAAGLSRFSLYNLTQVFNGGLMEGLALVFFLLSVYCFFKIISRPVRDVRWGNIRLVLLSQLFANLCIYCHERYLVLFPLFAIFIAISGKFKSMKLITRFGLITTALLAVLANIFIKQFIIHTPFLVGTGNTRIDFSFTQATSFFKDAVNSVFQINLGPGYLVGLPFEQLNHRARQLVWFSNLVLFATIIIAMVSVIRLSLKSRISIKKLLEIPLFCVLTFLFLIISVVITIRLEQRWLQAPFCIFVLGCAWFISSFPARYKSIKILAYFLLPVTFIFNNYHYLTGGANNIYMMHAERTVQKFETAIRHDVLHIPPSKILIWEQHRDVNTENEINWTLQDGYFFEVYQQHPKSIAFVDTANFKPNLTNVKYGITTEGQDTFIQVVSIKDSVETLLRETVKVF